MLCPNCKEKLDGPFFKCKYCGWVKDRGEISAGLWKMFCGEVWRYHIRKMAKFKTQEVENYLKNMGELELKIYHLYNGRQIPHQKYAFHKDFISVYEKIIS